MSHRKIIYRKFLNTSFCNVLPFDLSIKSGRAGFFGEVFCTLNGIRFAEILGRNAIVEWGRTSAYFDSSVSKNAWGAFFKDISFSFSNVDRYQSSFKIPFKPGGEDFIPYNDLSIRESLNIAIHKWCRPVDSVMDDVKSFIESKFLFSSILGVHVRQTDAQKGFEGRLSVGLSEFFNAVDCWLLDNPNGGIFLASDDSATVDMFKERYGFRVVCQDCIRSLDGSSIHGHYDYGVDGSGFSKGREVLIDSLILAHCDYLIRTHSRVTAFSLCWNLQLEYRDLELELHGVNRTPWLHL